MVDKYPLCLDCGRMQSRKCNDYVWGNTHIDLSHVRIDGQMTKSKLGRVKRMSNYTKNKLVSFAQNSKRQYDANILPTIEKCKLALKTQSPLSRQRIGNIWKST